MTDHEQLMNWIRHFRKARHLSTLDVMTVAARRDHPANWPTIEQAAEHREAEINLGTLLPLEA